MQRWLILLKGVVETVERGDRAADVYVIIFGQHEVCREIQNDLATAFDRNDAALSGFVNARFEGMVPGQFQRRVFDQFYVRLLRHHFAENMMRQ